MKMRFWRSALRLRHPWAIAIDLNNGGGKSEQDTLFVELTDEQGRTGLGETSPSKIYGDSVDSVCRFLETLDTSPLRFDDVDGSMGYLESLPNAYRPGACALNLALLDGAGRIAGKPVHELLGLTFEDDVHTTSLTIGIDTPEVMARKAAEAGDFEVLKLKLGSPEDRENFLAVRREAPGKRIRVDANASWAGREEALRLIEWLADDGLVEFVEQPLAPDTAPEDLLWLKDRSPLPLFADESYHVASDIARCVDLYHGVNVKLVKAGGASAAKLALEVARKKGLKTMIGCMMESSVLISAGAHLAGLADHLDLDSNMLITNDPYLGAHAHKGRLRFHPDAPETGLRITPR